MQDRDEKYEGQEDSEYHFSDDEISYDADSTESSKTETAVTPPKEGLIGSVTRSKRMMISLAVFIGLVFVVYKMVSPTAPSPQASDITAASPIPSVQPMAQANNPAPASTTTTPSSIMNQGANQPSAPAQAPQVIPVQSQLTSSPAANAPVPTSVQQAPPVPLPQTDNQQAVAVPPAPPAPPAPTTMPNNNMTANDNNSAVNIPVETAPMTPQPSVATSVPSPVSAAQTIPVPGADAVDSKVISMAAQNERLMSQLQAQYDQRITDYQNQNKNLQEQVQALNSKLAAMQSQMNQMMQSLARPDQSQAAPEPIVQAPPMTASDVKITYTVQAIIPGRAWLKSDNGETVTVAEGDEVKNLGKVTKIDPYDGVVEINTGSKVVSLSYGNGG